MQAPNSPALADAAANWTGAYVHIPFCARVCPYCDFAVVQGQDDQVGRYIEALVTEISVGGSWRPLDAVFVGGGTPSRIDPGLLVALIERLAEVHGLNPDAEVTMEANPEDWSSEKSDGFRRAGVTRVSFGAQSFDPVTLGTLGRRHGPADIMRAVERARTSGFSSISLDLILGTVGESLVSWEATLDDALELPIDHVSIYALTIERGTPFGRAVAAGGPSPNEDDQADKYELAVRRLGERGFVQYETSNFAKPGHACRYNLTAWAQGEYVAYGLGAHRHLDGTRSWNVRRFDAYLNRIESGESPIANSEALDAIAKEEERLIVGLRRLAGVEAGERGRRWLAGSAGQRLAEAGLVKLTEGRLVVTDPLKADTVAREIVGA